VREVRDGGTGHAHTSSRRFARRSGQSRLLYWPCLSHASEGHRHIERRDVRVEGVKVRGAREEIWGVGSCTHLE
jgi:hypothetical protein